MLYKDLRKPTKLAWQKSEDSLQLKCAEHAKKALAAAGEKQVFHHSPNGGRRSQREAAKFKLMGVCKGFSDIFLPLRSDGFTSLYIELKKAGGYLEPEQKDYLNTVSAEGALAVVVNDFQTFCDVFDYYLQQRQLNKPDTVHFT